MFCLNPFHNQLSHVTAHVPMLILHAHAHAHAHIHSYLRRHHNLICIQIFQYKRSNFIPRWICCLRQSNKTAIILNSHLDSLHHILSIRMNERTRLNIAFVCNEFNFIWTRFLHSYFQSLRMQSTFAKIYYCWIVNATIFGAVIKNLTQWRCHYFIYSVAFYCFLANLIKFVCIQVKFLHQYCMLKIPINYRSSWRKLKFRFDISAGILGDFFFWLYFFRNHYWVVAKVFRFWKEKFVYVCVIWNEIENGIHE